MFLGYQKNKIKFYTETPLDTRFYNLDKVEETEDKYVLVNDEYVLGNSKQALEQERGKYIKLNDRLRDEALLGGVEYQGVTFDSDTDQKVNLLATVGAMSDEDTILWFGMDNQGLLCTKADLVAIGGLITELHSYCWNMNAHIKEQIARAQTLEELESIEIKYNRYDI